jgi:pyridoxine 5-phosphate synthase
MASPKRRVQSVEFYEPIFFVVSGAAPPSEAMASWLRHLTRQSAISSLDNHQESQRLEPIIAELHDLGSRVSIFMDADSDQWGKARELGADRVELYTQPYAEAFARNDFDMVFEKYAVAAKAAQSAGLGVNAGHDLNLQNLGKFCEIPGILEVSIGHALVADSLEMGMTDAVRAYLRVLTAAIRG